MRRRGRRAGGNSEWLHSNRLCKNLNYLGKERGAHAITISAINFTGHLRRSRPRKRRAGLDAAKVVVQDNEAKRTQAAEGLQVQTIILPLAFKFNFVDPEYGELFGCDYTNACFIFLLFIFF